jgi:hypothetical protein
MPVFIGFLCCCNAAHAPAPLTQTTAAGLYATERKLLIFAAWLTAQFRIVSSVTILQQIIHLRAGPDRGVDAAALRHERPRKG